MRSWGTPDSFYYSGILVYPSELQTVQPVQASYVFNVITLRKRRMVCSHGRKYLCTLKTETLKPKRDF